MRPLQAEITLFVDKGLGGSRACEVSFWGQGVPEVALHSGAEPAGNRAKGFLFQVIYLPGNPALVGTGSSSPYL